MVTLLSDLLVRGLEHVGSAIVGDRDATVGADRTVAADGVPVLLVGGLGTAVPVLRPMADWLAGLGHPVRPVAVGAGLDCAGRSVDVVVAHIAELARETGRPVAVVGHSRGGQFARAAAVRAPDDVAGLVTIGTPFDLYRLGGSTLLAAAALAVAGSAGLGDIARLSCLFGGCCREFRAHLRGDWPSGTPFTSIYSTGDRIVPARASIDPAAENVEVPGSHLGMLTGRTARAAVVDALDRCADRALARAS